jgi:hypothetical protein
MFYLISDLLVVGPGDAFWLELDIPVDFGRCGFLINGIWFESARFKFLKIQSKNTGKALKIVRKPQKFPVKLIDINLAHPSNKTRNSQAIHVN